jgi:hypothetical protein
MGDAGVSPAGRGRGARRKFESLGKNSETRRRNACEFAKFLLSKAFELTQNYENQ